MILHEKYYMEMRVAKSRVINIGRKKELCMNADGLVLD